MKILKSSPNPKMKVAITMFTKLNLISNKLAIPIVQIQPRTIGKKENKASSNLPYTNIKEANTIKPEKNNK